MKHFKIFIICLTVLIVLSTCSRKNDAINKLQVFVSILPQKYFVERITGDKIDVKVLVKPGESPATYNPTPQQMKGLTEAQIYFRIGVPFEQAWLSKIQNNNQELKIIDTRQNIELMEMDNFAEISQEYLKQNEGKFLKTEVDPHYYEHNKFDFKYDSTAVVMDPHIWLSPELVKIQTETIYRALIELDSENAPFYQSNLAHFHHDLDKLSVEIETALASIKNRRFLVFHPSWGYFARQFNLKQIPIEIHGKTPGMKMITDIILFSKLENLEVIFVQEQFSTHEAEAIAEVLNARVIKIDPLAENYLNNMRNIAHTFKEQLEQE